MTVPVPEVLAKALSLPYRPQGPFEWSRKHWVDRMHDIPEVQTLLPRLPERLDRGFVAETVSTELEAGRVLSGFIAAMAWGWGDKGARGAVRTRWVLTGVKGPGDIVTPLPVDPSVAERLQRGAEKIRGRGAVEGYREMNTQSRIKHLASSYFTKWLHFCSATSAVEGPEAAPILDEQIISWLGPNAGIVLKPGSTMSYAEYLDLLNEWGRPYERTAVQVETEIFRLATGRG